MKVRALFSKISMATAKALGTWQAFFIACMLIILWVVGGFFVGFGNSIYQLAINTTTSIVTFLMVFLIQASQNRDTYALHAKIDEVILATPKARDHLREIETLPEEELMALRGKTLPPKAPREPRSRK